jgi:hypothetical protein
MNVGVFEVFLNDVVVNVLNAHLSLYLVRPIASNCSITSVPVASWVSVWSMRIRLSSPGSCRRATDATGLTYA